ncbi:MAG: SCO family protein [Caulobacteraceae bacterium]|nr:SCO family protein [Caulobacteraceae bacterium]
MIRKGITSLALATALTLGLAACKPGPAGGSSHGASASIGGPFKLIDQNGRPVDQTVIKGKWTAVFFGYTYCPDVCPTTLQTLGTTIDQMGGRAKALQVVFITVDPARDTPAQLKDYLSSSAFPRGVIGLTGSPEQVASVASAYKVYFEKSGTGANYSVNHSSAIYLMNPKGEFDSVIAFGLTPDQTREQIVKAMRAAG